MPPIDYVGAIIQLINLVQQLIARAKQTGELTVEQETALQTYANSVFAKYSEPAPPPPGVTAGPGP